jgi:ribosome-binding factor A
MKPQMRYSEDRKIRRHHRVVELLRQEITKIIQKEVKDPRLGPFTISEVVLSPDLRSARISVCRFVTGEGQREPSKEERDSLVDGLSSASHFIYERLKKRLAMKQIPSLRFEYDYRMSELSTIWNLVKSANETQSESSDEPDKEGASYGSI